MIPIAFILTPLSLRELPEALSPYAPLSFKQSWRTDLQLDFLPAQVHLGSDLKFLYGYTILHDLKIGNKSTRKGERTWEMGDLFEIFIKREDQSDYWELHVTPENFHLSLHLPPLEQRQEIPIDDQLSLFWQEVPEFQSKVWIEPNLSQWRIAWKIPWEIFGKEDPRSFQWKMAFCRYDYGEEGEPPIHSSTAPLTKLNFHQVQEWQDFEINRPV